MRIRLKSSTVIKIAAITFLAAVSLLLVKSVDLASFSSPAVITSWLEQAGSLAPFLFMGIMALTVASPLPSLPLDIAAGAFFGPVPGTLYSAVGALGHKR